MYDSFVGEIRLFAGNFEPANWLFCDGRLLPINQHQHLFSLIGTRFGGDGRSTFALPDLRGRVPVAAGHGPGLSDRTLGQSGGVQLFHLSQAQMPAHSHPLYCNDKEGSGTENSPAGMYFAVGETNRSTSAPINNRYAASAPAGETMAANLTTLIGGGQMMGNLQPSLAMRYIICVQLEQS